MLAKGLFCLKLRTREVHEVETRCGGRMASCGSWRDLDLRLCRTGLAEIHDFFFPAYDTSEELAFWEGLGSPLPVPEDTSLTQAFLRQFMFNVKKN